MYVNMSMIVRRFIFYNLFSASRDIFQTLVTLVRYIDSFQCNIENDANLPFIYGQI